MLTFDYRGWGDSDGVGGERKVVDPDWQLRDASTSLDYLSGGGVSGVDTERIGIWGSSM